MKDRIPESEFILNADGSVYHLHLRNEDIADTVILVGDPGRVSVIASYFDKVEVEKQNREIHTKTGYVGDKRLTVISTGMGTDNIDIVVNELDAAVNIDPKTRIVKENKRVLNLIRLGTSGGLNANINAGDFIASAYTVGLDGLLYFYENSESVFERKLIDKFIKHTEWKSNLPSIYSVKASSCLLEKYAFDLKHGITLTSPGFYAPQGRELRLNLAFPEFNGLVENFYYKDIPIANFEMESSALYGLGQMLGHNTLTICTIIANRVNKTFSNNYKEDVERMIELVLGRL
ncbi:MAG: nucleoside phosphorylase [Bacteroidales bacterium]